MNIGFRIRFLASLLILVVSAGFACAQAAKAVPSKTLAPKVSTAPKLVWNTIDVHKLPALGLKQDIDGYQLVFYAGTETDAQKYAAAQGYVLVTRTELKQAFDNAFKPQVDAKCTEVASLPLGTTVKEPLLVARIIRQ